MQQSSSLDFKLVQRVCLLQQALDQALESLDELKAQVQDKQWVETQLASTEKYANVQQQAITHLKQQLAQFTEVQDHLLGVMSYRLNELIDQQQQAFNHLDIEFRQSHAELQTYLQYLGQQQVSQNYARGSDEHCLALEAEIMVARSMAVHLSQHISLAKRHLGQLSTDLGNHHLNLGQMIKTVRSMITELKTFDSAQATIQAEFSEDAVLTKTVPTGAIAPSADESTAPDSDPSPEMDAGILEAALRRQNLRIHELQTVLMEQIEHETQLRQRYQAIALERDYYRRELLRLQRAQAHQQDAVIPTPPAPLPDEATDSPHFPATTAAARHRRRSRHSQPIQPLQLPPEPEG